jgi:Leucine-rich repeat (LRR) protein
VVSFRNYRSITNQELRSLTNLTSLSLEFNGAISDDGLSTLTQLTALQLESVSITNRSLSVLTNLTSLRLVSGILGYAGLDAQVRVQRNDNGLSSLVNLTHLHLDANARWTTVCIDDLTNLVSLSMSRCAVHGIQVLTNLTSLYIGDSAYFYDQSKAEPLEDDALVNSLSHLQSLDIMGGYELFSNSELMQMTNLTALNLSYDSENISDAGLSGLTLLRTLNLDENGIITNAGISNLTNLTSLSLNGDNLITKDGITTLTNLTFLGLNGNRVIEYDELICFPNLVSVDHYL